ncbi:MAG TPA: hypothetical protein VF043_33575 [Ktedonobacteraceae bacterium]
MTLTRGASCAAPAGVVGVGVEEVPLAAEVFLPSSQPPSTPTPKTTMSMTTITQIARPAGPRLGAAAGC